MSGVWVGFLTLGKIIMTHQNTTESNNLGNIETSDGTVTAYLVPDNERLSITADLFGFFFPMKLEPVIYHFAGTLAEAYNGGYWAFYRLSNGGFYMAPEQDEPFGVQSINGFTGSLSAEALGITACLYAYSHLSFGAGPFAESCAEHYHRLLDYACEHPEAGVILRVID